MTRDPARAASPPPAARRPPGPRALAAGLLVALAGSAGSARATRFAIAPYLQDARPGGVSVVFETDEAVAASVLLGAPGEEQRFASPSGTHHEVRIDGLGPGRHPYRVVLGDDPRATGATASAPGELCGAMPPAIGAELSFLVYGDNRDRDEDHARVVAAMLRERGDFLLNTGDLVGDAGESALWPRFFRIEELLLAGTPLYPALGNHELLHDPEALHFHRHFVLPEDAKIPEDRERYYTFRFGNCALIALDGNHSGDRGQAEWLDERLRVAQADPSVQHVFVYFHQPSFSVGDFCGSASEQGLWVPRFEKYGVRAVFTGHEHAYERLERKGVRYFVVGGGGAPLTRQSEDCPGYDRDALRLFRPVHHFLRVRIRGAEADLEAIGTDGDVFDRVRLHDPVPAAAREELAVPYRHLIDGAPGAAPSSGGGPAWPRAGWLALAAAVLVAGAVALRKRRRRS